VAKHLVVVVLHALLLPLLRLQRLPLVDVLVLVRLLKGHRALLLLLLEDVLGARTCASIDDVCPVLSRVPRKLLPSLDNEDTGIADFSSPVLCKLEAVRAVILVLTTVREPRAA